MLGVGRHHIHSEISQSWEVKWFNISNVTFPGASVANWQGTFGGIDPDCQGSFPSNATHSGSMGALAIYQVPRTSIYGANGGLLRFIGLITGRADVLQYLHLPGCSGFSKWTHVATMPVSLWLRMPFLQVSQSTVDVTRGGETSFYVNSQRGNAEIGLPVNLRLYTANQKQVVPSAVGLEIHADQKTNEAIQNADTDAYPRRQQWFVEAASTAAPGNYTILVDTAPGGQTDSTREPIPVNVVVK